MIAQSATPKMGGSTFFQEHPARVVGTAVYGTGDASEPSQKSKQVGRLGNNKVKPAA